MKRIKYLLSLLLVLAFVLTFSLNTKAETKTYYTSPDGVSTNTGLTIDSPLDIRTALLGLSKGDTLLVSPGRYLIKMEWINETTILNPGTINLEQYGDYNNYITVRNSSTTEKAIIDFSDQTFNSNHRGIQIRGNYWHLYGLDICGAGDNGLYIGGSYNIIENCEFYENRDSGLQLGRSGGSLTDINDWPHCNLIKNCTSWNNYDDETFGENADGFAAKLTVGYGNVFDGCIAFNNSDDGWDMYAKADTGTIGICYLFNCVAYSNGFLPDGSVTRDGDGNGFKLGGSIMTGNDYLFNCVAFNNRMHGVTDNSNPGVLSINSVTSYNNGVEILEFPESHELYGNPYFIGYANQTTFKADGQTANIDCARTSSSYNNFTGLLSVNTNGAMQDSYLGSIAYSIVSTSQNKYNVIRDYIEGSTYDPSSQGETYNHTITLDDFKSLDFDYLNHETVHKRLRNSDGSINLGDFLSLKETSPLYTLYNGSYVGASLNKNSYNEYEHLNFTDQSGLTYSVNRRDAYGVFDTLSVVHDERAIYQDLTLPVYLNGCNISWVSSDESLLSIGTKVETGLSNYQTIIASSLRDRSGDKNVKLTATITKGDVTLTKEFNLVIKKDFPSLGKVEGLNNKYIVDQYSKFTNPTINVTNGSSKSGRLLEEGLDKDYTVELRYEYAKDKNSKFYPISKIYTNKAGVYKLIYLIKSNINSSDTKEVYTYVYVSSPKSPVDFVSQNLILNLTTSGIKVMGNVSGVMGKVYCYIDLLNRSEVTKDLIKQDGYQYDINDDFVSFDLDTPNENGYKVYIIVSNREDTIDSEIYTTEITARHISTIDEFYDLSINGVDSHNIILLDNDLDFSSYKWQVTQHTSQVKGLINGLNHTISNLTIKDNTNTTNINVFYKLTGGALMNINFNEINLSGGANTKNSSIIGSMSDSYVKNVKVKNINTIALEASAGLIAKITGKDNYIELCSVINDEGYIIGANQRYVGGLVGLIQRDTSETSLKVVIKNVHVKATIGNNKDTGGYVGGIVGRGKNDKQGDYLEINSAIYEGHIITNKDYSGGIIGGNDNGIGAVIIKNCVSISKITRCGTTYEYVEKPVDYDPETWIDTVGHKGGSPITGRYANPTGDGYYIFDNNYALFADNNAVVNSITDNVYNRIKTEAFFKQSVKLDLDNVWIFDDETKTISLR